MRKTGIVTDGHSSITSEEAKKLDIWMLPMPFYFGEECFYEDKMEDRDAFFQRLKRGEKVATSQPSPAAVMDIWNEALAECEEILYMPISSGLSGAYNTAKALSDEDEYKGKVFVVDNGRVSTPAHRNILDALDMISKGYDAAFIQASLEKARDNMCVYIAVDDLTYLKNGGRMSASSAFIGSMLNIKPILKLETGLLGRYKESRGMAKARKDMIAAMKNDFETRFKEWVDKGEIYLMAASSASPEVTEGWVKEIEAAFPGYDVRCDDLALAVSCHIGPGGLGIACSCRPEY